MRASTLFLTGGIAEESGPLSCHPGPRFPEAHPALIGSPSMIRRVDLEAVLRGRRDEPLNVFGGRRERTILPLDGRPADLQEVVLEPGRSHADQHPGNSLAVVAEPVDRPL